MEDDSPCPRLRMKVFTVDVAITQYLHSVDTSPHMSPRQEEGEVSEADEELLCKTVCVDLPVWYLKQVAQAPRHRVSRCQRAKHLCRP